MKKNMCVDCEKRPISAEQRRIGGSLCEPCCEWAEWENEHSDNAHDEILSGEELFISAERIAEIREGMSRCPICQNHPHPRETFKPGHTNTVAKTYTSHAECTHPRTPKGRAICRAARTAAARAAESQPAKKTRRTKIDERMEEARANLV